MLSQSRIVNQDYEEGKHEFTECYKKTKAARNNYYVGEDSGSEDHADGKIFSSPGSKRCPLQTIKSYLKN